MPLRLVGHPAPDFKLVGTRSCAIRHRTSEKGEHLVKPMGKSLSSDSARARSQKQQKKTRRDVQRRTRGSVWVGNIVYTRSDTSFTHCLGAESSVSRAECLGQ